MPIFKLCQVWIKECPIRFILIGGLLGPSLTNEFILTWSPSLMEKLAYIYTGNWSIPPCPQFKRSLSSRVNLTLRLCWIFLIVIHDTSDVQSLSFLEQSVAMTEAIICWWSGLWIVDRGGGDRKAFAIFSQSLISFFHKTESVLIGASSKAFLQSRFLYSAFQSIYLVTRYIKRCSNLVILGEIMCVYVTLLIPSIRRRGWKPYLISYMGAIWDSDDFLSNRKQISSL